MTGMPPGLVKHIVNVPAFLTGADRIAVKSLDPGA